ncbi:hypothetical protein J6590_038732 [Homalodisca vitripennis]|nr:hypothetical protein J6590_038732 [Homalodisca vitripennis]
MWPTALELVDTRLSQTMSSSRRYICASLFHELGGRQCGQQRWNLLIHVCRRECHQVGDIYVRACFTHWVSNRVSPHVIRVTTMSPTALELFDTRLS